MNVNQYSRSEHRLCVTDLWDDVIGFRDENFVSFNERGFRQTVLFWNGTLYSSAHFDQYTTV